MNKSSNKNYIGKDMSEGYDFGIASTISSPEDIKGFQIVYNKTLTSAGVSFDLPINIRNGDLMLLVISSGSVNRYNSSVYTGFTLVDTNASSIAIGATFMDAYILKATYNRATFGSSINVSSSSDYLAHTLIIIRGASIKGFNYGYSSTYSDTMPITPSTPCLAGEDVIIFGFLGNTLPSAYQYGTVSGYDLVYMSINDSDSTISAHRKIVSNETISGTHFTKSISLFTKYITYVLRLGI